MSKPKVTSPTITVETCRGGSSTHQRIDHPAFAQIQVSHINGHKVLYNSDFNSRNYIALRIHKSEMIRDLSHDWHHEREQYIEVAMSEVQWATLVSSLNSTAIPCTLTYLLGQCIDRLPEPTNRINQFGSELSKHLGKAVEQLSELRKTISSLGLSKVKTENLLSMLSNAQTNIMSNTQFVENSFNEHMENQVEKAKCDANAYLYHVIQRAGLDALTLGIEAPKPAEDTE
jgi:hypothetical protein